MIHTKLLEIRRVVRESFNRTKRNGAGASVHPDGKPLPLSCVIVGVERGPIVENLDALDAPAIGELVCAWVSSRMDLFEDSAIFLGSWVDPDTGRVHFDFSKAFTDKRAGLLAARERGEIAVYDTDLKDSVKVADCF